MEFQVLTLLTILAAAYARPGIVEAPAVAHVPAVAVHTEIAHYSVPSVQEVHGVAAVPTATIHAGANARDIYRAQDAKGNYQVGYSVSDTLTGDMKHAHESDHHGAKVGSFSQLDPNGYERRTDYVSDAFGTRQVITGSEYGLYVNAHDHTIQPHDGAHVAAVAPPAEVHAVAAPVVHAAPVVAHHGYAAGIGHGVGHGLGHAGGYGGFGLGYGGHGLALGHGFGHGGGHGGGHGFGYGVGHAGVAVGHGYGHGGGHHGKF